MPPDGPTLGACALLVPAVGAGVHGVLLVAQIAAAVAIWGWRAVSGRDTTAEKPAVEGSGFLGTGSAVRRAGGQILGSRQTQEDDLGFIDSSVLDPDGHHPVAVVADGMGGHASGDVASRLAVRAFVEAYGVQGRPAERLRGSLRHANEALAGAIRADRSLDGMGSTLVAAALSSGGLEWISVGDSRLYLARDGRIKRLNADHSMAPVIAAIRDIDPQAANGLNPNELRSALVGGDIARIDASALPETLLPRDIVLLASDGLGTLDDGEIARIVGASRDGGPEAVSDALLAAVESRAAPRQDNVTVALLEAPAPASDSGRGE